MALTDSQVERYSRQILVPQVGGRGQEQLLKSEIHCYGESPSLRIAAQYLTAAGAVTHFDCDAKGTPTHPVDAILSTFETAASLPGAKFTDAPWLAIAGVDQSGAWYSRATRLGNCWQCIGDVAQRLSQANGDTSLSTRCERVVGAALALDLIRGLLGLPISDAVVHFGRGGLLRRVEGLQGVACKHRSTATIR